MPVAGSFSFQPTFPLTAGVIALSAAAAGLATLFFVALIYWADHYEREPAWLIAAAFFWGAVPSIMAAIILTGFFTITPTLLFGPGAGELAGAVVFAPLVEESLKALALVGILVYHRHELDSPLDGIIYGATVGLGFAMVENFLYFVGAYAEAGPSAWGTSVLLRSVIFGLNHALFTSATGLGIALARLAPQRERQAAIAVGGWAAAVALHAVHNLAAAGGGLLCLVALFSDWGGVALMAGIVVWALAQEGRWIRAYLAEEVDLGTLTAAQYELVCTGRRRLAHGARILVSAGPAAFLRTVRFYYRCSELAYKKHHRTILQESGGDQRVEAMRVEVSRLGQLLD